MGKMIDAKSILYGLMLMFLLQFSSLVGAFVDIIFYEDTSNCVGSGYSFGNIGDNICCEIDEADGGSVSVTASSGAGCLGANYYVGGDCSVLDYESNGNFCVYGGGFTGAYWYNSCGRRRRSLLGEFESKKAATCDSKIKPTGVAFTEDGSKGNWILTSSNPSELYSQLKNVHDAEKVNWLQSKGATYKALDSDEALQLDSKQG